MSSIRDLFNSEGLSLYETLSSNDVVGFLVPLYQRRYSWDKSHVERLLQDILDGVEFIKTDKSTLSFIGAAIFVEADVEAFRNKASSIVDGQQRLTTLILICAKMHLILNEKKIELEKENGEVIDFLCSLVSDRLDELFTCFAKSKVGLPKKNSDYYPIIIREHKDQWHKDHLSCSYESPVADYLNKYINFVYDDDKKDFSWSPKKEGIDINFFIDNGEFIEKWLQTKLFNCTIFDDPINKVFNSKIGSELIGVDPDNKSTLVKSYKDVQDKKSVMEVISLLCFSEYLLRRVAITNVRVAAERYGFDIFEALNTTGAPLTALETFRPVVARYEETTKKDEGGYERSDAKLVFDDIDRYLDTKEKTTTKNKESQQIVVTFGLLINGEKIAEKLDVQRVKLKAWYESIDAKKYDARAQYVNLLGEVASFKNDFWDFKKINQQLKVEHAEREEILFHLDFIRESKTTMAIPIILRFYLDYKVNGDAGTFLEACRLTAYFIAIWRAFTSNTGAIDGAFKALMMGGTVNSKEMRGFKLGCNLDIKNPGVDHLKTFYKNLLIKKKIKNKSIWIKISGTQPLYEGSQELCKYLLLLAHHNTKFSDRKLIKGMARAHDSSNFKKIVTLRSPIHRTVEHIAPQNFAPEWDAVFDKDATTIHTIGNLTLLPLEENSAVGNKSWSRKRLFFKACATSTIDELDVAIKEAKFLGHDFGKKISELLQTGERLSMAEHLCSYDEWNNLIVKERSVNILESAWCELNHVLELEEEPQLDLIAM